LFEARALLSRVITIGHLSIFASASMSVLSAVRSASTTTTIWPMWVARTGDSVVRRSGGESNTMTRSR
jgi:hypothetical protein